MLNRQDHDSMVRNNYLNISESPNTFSSFLYIYKMLSKKALKGDIINPT